MSNNNNEDLFKSFISLIKKEVLSLEEIEIQPNPNFNQIIDTKNKIEKKEIIV